MYANLTPSVTWSLLRGSSTGDVSSTNVIPGRIEREGGRKMEVRERGREGLRKDKMRERGREGQQGRGEHTERKGGREKVGRRVRQLETSRLPM